MARRGAKWGSILPDGVAAPVRELVLRMSGAMALAWAHHFAANGGMNR
jgi:hypothetical protein